MIVDLSFPHEYEIAEDLNGPYIGDSEIRLTNVSGYDYFRCIVVSRKRWILSVQAGRLCGILSTPAPQILCAVSFGECFLVDTSTPEPSIKGIAPDPAVDFKVLLSNELLLLIGFTSIVAVGKTGNVAWKSADLAHDGLKITKVEDNFLEGIASGVPPHTHGFVLDLKSGRHTGGFSWSGC